MPLEITERRVKDVVVLELNGRLTMGPGCDALDKHLQDLISAQSRAVLLHCGKLASIDSQGIKVLVRAATRLQQQDGQLKLCCLVARVREVLEITRLVRVLEPFASEADGVASFGTPARGTA